MAVDNPGSELDKASKQDEAGTMRSVLFLLTTMILMIALVMGLVMAACTAVLKPTPERESLKHVFDQMTRE